MYTATLSLSAYVGPAVLIAIWLIGVALLASLFLYNRERIRAHDHEL